MNEEKGDNLVTEKAKKLDAEEIERLKEAFKHLQVAHQILGQLGEPVAVAEKATRVPIYTVALLLSNELGFDMPAFR